MNSNLHIIQSFIKRIGVVFFLWFLFHWLITGDPNPLSLTVDKIYREMRKKASVKTHLSPLYEEEVYANSQKLVSGLCNYIETLNDLNFKCSDGTTPLIALAKRSLFCKDFEHTFRNHADLNMCDNQKRTALIWNTIIATTDTTSVKLKETFKFAVQLFLLDEGAAIDKVDTFGKTALIYAVENNNYQYAEILLKSGADIYATSISALDYAKTDSMKLILETYKERNLRPSYKSYGRTYFNSQP